MIRLQTEGDPGSLLRRGVLALAALGIAGTTLELVFLRHWDSATKAVVWPAMAALALAAALIVVRPGRRTIVVARALAAGVAAIALIGIWFHVTENLTAGPLDRAYATTWDTMSGLEQLWTAVSGGVGPTPTLAPGVLAEIALALLLATVSHPATAAIRRRTPRGTRRMLPDVDGVRRIREGVEVDGGEQSDRRSAQGSQWLAERQP